MSRTLAPRLSALAACLLVAACGTSAGPTTPTSGDCGEPGLSVSATPQERVGDTDWLIIELTNCSEQAQLLGSHPHVHVHGGDIIVRREGAPDGSIPVGPGETLVAPLMWKGVTEPAPDTVTVDRLLVDALPQYAGQAVTVDPSVALRVDHVLRIGAWQPADAGHDLAATIAAGNDACPDEGFHIDVYGSEAAMGVRAVGIEMVNCGDASIEVEGYPAVEVLHHGAPVQVHVRHGSDSLDDPGPSRIVVEPGESVRAGMLWRHKVESTDAADIVHATELRVSHTAAAPRQLVEPEYPVDLGTTRYLEVTAWRSSW